MSAAICRRINTSNTRSNELMLICLIGNSDRNWTSISRSFCKHTILVNTTKSNIMVGDCACANLNSCSLGINNPLNFKWSIVIWEDCCCYTTICWSASEVETNHLNQLTSLHIVWLSSFNLKNTSCLGVCCS